MKSAGGGSSQSVTNQCASANVLNETLVDVDVVTTEGGGFACFELIQLATL